MSVQKAIQKKKTQKQKRPRKCPSLNVLFIFCLFCRGLRWWQHSKGFEAAKEDGDVAANLNRMPVLNHNGELFGQVGPLTGLTCSSAWVTDWAAVT